MSEETFEATARWWDRVGLLFGQAYETQRKLRAHRVAAAAAWKGFVVNVGTAAVALEQPRQAWYATCPHCGQRLEPHYPAGAHDRSTRTYTCADCNWQCAYDSSRGYRRTGSRPPDSPQMQSAHNLSWLVSPSRQPVAGDVLGYAVPPPPLLNCSFRASAEEQIIYLESYLRAAQDYLSVPQHGVPTTIPPFATVFALVQWAQGILHEAGVLAAAPLEV